MNKTNLSAIDMNLVLVLAALLEEASVTKAAKRIGRSQSAVSHALSRLRALLGDPLFVRSPEGMSPTPFALSLAEPVKEVLQRMESLFQSGNTFVPATDRRCFTIGFTDYTSFVFLPRLVAELERLAPKAELVVKNTSYTLGHGMVEGGEAEIVVGNFPAPPNFVREKVLYREEFVCVMNKNHPAANGQITLEQYERSRHVLVSLQGKMPGYLDKALHKLGIVRKSNVIIGHFMLVPFILQKNDAIATEPSRLIIPLAKVLGLKTCPPPFAIPPQSIKMAWHRRYDDDSSHRWLRELIHRLAES